MMRMNIVLRRHSQPSAFVVKAIKSRARPSRQSPNNDTLLSDVQTMARNKPFSECSMQTRPRNRSTVRNENE